MKLLMNLIRKPRRNQVGGHRQQEVRERDSIRERSRGGDALSFSLPLLD